MGAKVVKMKRRILLLVLFLVCPTVLLAFERFPGQCKVSGLRYRYGKVTFYAQHTAKPRLYAIQNIGNHPLWLSYQANGSGMSAGWDSKILPKHWSAILVTHPIFTFGCRFLLKSGKMNKTPCSKVLRICQFSHFYANDPISGGYWVGENLSLNALLVRIQGRGLVVNQLS